MEQSGDDHWRHINTPRALERLDRMVEAGQITQGDAAGLRAAADSGSLAEAVTEIRLRHARGRLAAAVEDGRLSQEDAEALLGLLDKGAHPRLLRGLRGPGR